MKKMVCEICGSQSIRKENNVFVCKECGTEYSIDDARLLLKEVDATLNQEQLSTLVDHDKQKTEKEKMIIALTAWANYLYSFDNCDDWLQIIGNGTDDPLFWSKENIDLIKTQNLCIKPELKNDDFNESLHFSLLSGNDIKQSGYFKSLKPSTCWLLLNNEVIKTSCDVELDYLIYGLKKYVESTDGMYRWDLPSSLSGSEVRDWVKEVPYGTKFMVNVYYYKSVQTGGFFKKTITVKQDLDVFYKDWVVKMIDKAIESKEQIKKLHNEKYIYLKSHFDEMKNSILKLFESLSLFVDLFDLPIKYRSVSAVSSLLELFSTGRADSWKEAVNIYETEKYQANLLCSLGQINASLGSINNTLLNGFSYIGNKLNSIGISIDKIANDTSELLNLSYENNYALKRIMYDTRYSLISSIIK